MTSKPMTVEELRRLLRNVPDTAEVAIRGFGDEWNIKTAYDDGVQFDIVVDEETE